MSLPEGLRKLSYNNTFVRELPVDAIEKNYVRQVRGACSSLVQPKKVAGPQLVAFASEVAKSLDLTEEDCRSQAFADVFGGNLVLDGMKPFAACYGGHQFGHWAGQLGDGRAMTLGEAVNQSWQRYDLQLKGAGPTPYSRSADGRAVLRSSVREFLCSEAMHHLGVPTTRALSLVTTGDPVVRDMFYDGHPKAEPGAVVCRVAPTFLRFGNYQLFAARDDTNLLRRLADYTLRHHFPHLGAGAYEAWFNEVCLRTAKMITHWMRVGFVHGVMNTDNMSVLGLTIDYGPYGWLDDYDPTWTPNTTDAGRRRYRYGAQPQIAVWNLSRFGEAIAPLIGSLSPIESALSNCVREMETLLHEMMGQKLGLMEAREEDEGLFDTLVEVLPETETDMTIFFRSLADIDLNGDAKAALEVVHPAYYGKPKEAAVEKMHAWLERYIRRAGRDERPNDVRRASMNAVNPKFVLRNYLAQLAIDKAEEGDNSMVWRLLDVMRRPYDEQPKNVDFAKKRPDWAKDKPGCSMLSCSS